MTTAEVSAFELESGAGAQEKAFSNSVFTTSGRRIGNFLEDSSILDDIAAQRVVYVTDLKEKSALKLAIRTDSAVQASERIPQVRFLHGFEGDVVNAAARQLNGKKRVTEHHTILNRQRIANHQVEVHVGKTNGPRVHIDRNTSNAAYIKLTDPDWHEFIPRKVLENKRVSDAIMRAAFFGFDY